VQNVLYCAFKPCGSGVRHSTTAASRVGLSISLSKCFGPTYKIAIQRGRLLSLVIVEAIELIKYPIKND